MQNELCLNEPARSPNIKNSATWQLRYKPLWLLLRSWALRITEALDDNTKHRNLLFSIPSYSIGHELNCCMANHVFSWFSVIPSIQCQNNVRNLAIVTSCHILSNSHLSKSSELPAESLNLSTLNKLNPHFDVFLLLHAGRGLTKYFDIPKINSLFH
jgi:hypothetical protein